MGGFVVILRSMITAGLLASLAIASVSPRCACPPSSAAAASTPARNAAACHCSGARIQSVGPTVLTDDSDEFSAPLSAPDNGAVVADQHRSVDVAGQSIGSLHLSASLLAQGTRLNC